MSLLETACVLALTGLTVMSALPPLSALVGSSQLEYSAQAIVAALNMARSESMRSKQDVFMCAMHLKSDDKIDKCHATSWQDGVLVFADKVKRSRDGELGAAQWYDAGESLRELTLSSAVSIRTSSVKYRLLSNGQWEDKDEDKTQIVFTLYEQHSDRCVVISAQNTQPKICRARSLQCQPCVIS